MGLERRHTSRLRAYLPLQLHRLDPPRVVDTLTKDLGPGGLRCLSLRPVPVGTDMRVELTFGAGQERLVARGTTRWFRALPYSEQFELGIAFTDLSAENERRLSTYLDHLSHQTVPASA